MDKPPQLAVAPFDGQFASLMRDGNGKIAVGRNTTFHGDWFAK